LLSVILSPAASVYSGALSQPGCNYRKIEALPNSNSDGLVVVLVSPRNPLNIGAAARALSNFGFQRLRLVNPYEVAFQGARSAVGASHVLDAAEQFDTVATAVADCSVVIGTTAVRDRELLHPIRNLSSGTGSAIREQLTAGRVALLFGSEKYGLSNEDLSHCHWLLRIPTHSDNISMNLGQAVAVCLYELARSEAPEETTGERRYVTGVEEERVVQSLLDALRNSGPVMPGTEMKVRRLVHRLKMESHDAEALLGMLRQIRWKLGHTEEI
jgi:tRNA/rRNA methyltransferase